MPERPFFLRLPVMLVILLVLVAGGVTYHIFTAPEKIPEALPMKGKCTDYAINTYTGAGDKDGKSCLWRGRLYWCLFDTNKTLWYCNVVEPAPAEKK